ncbi:NAD(P)-binding protein [Coemansia reversa NRRL 1564]|uniref:NAD(P)-binding protein n=1 Tax=Coemansia reversa (strain ATCC 12441 / NRRL 1564) TaxID=763665 RepID=A0A2G5BHY5_COERN|nr:NAD(P)-binding protein [Coemansia reversa NRRL 1564]|eukprot:PIA18638.1 NAD(P)-binding protein [Coemansia reversa NRRL 1564]
MVKLIAIIGATGLQGGSVLKTFHASGEYKIRAITRNPNSNTVKDLSKKYAGVEWVQADLNDPSSLSKAFSGADFVFGVTNSVDADLIQNIQFEDFEVEYKQGKNIVDAAIAAKVDSLILSTMYSIKKLSGGKYSGALHLEAKYNAEQYLRSKASQIKGIILHIGSYLENFTRIARITDDQTIEFPFSVKPTTKLPFVDTANDTGPVVKHALENSEECLGLTLEVRGSHYEAQQIAKAYTEATGKPARYSFDEFGYFGFSTEFVERNKKINHKFVTPTEFWKNLKWEGPSK